ncbi:hypothetical protein [Rhizobium bangladeshense]|uniref:hypothetical protein n=1 Tax=Rhizobium bangladeshense TaxID=1138189 RepID=UPI002180C0D5|nr:hypothetical protein [Rhizobium bangladeshense]
MDGNRNFLACKRSGPFFCFKRDQPLFGGWYLKLWFGWVNKAYDRRNDHYAFQIAPKRQ